MPNARPDARLTCCSVWTLQGCRPNPHSQRATGLPCRGCLTSCQTPPGKRNPHLSHQMTTVAQHVQHLIGSVKHAFGIMAHDAINCVTPWTWVTTTIVASLTTSSPRRDGTRTAHYATTHVMTDTCDAPMSCINYAQQNGELVRKTISVLMTTLVCSLARDLSAVQHAPG